MENIKDGLIDKYIYIDGKKFIGQLQKKKECEYYNIPNFKRKTKELYISKQNSHLKGGKNSSKIKKEVPTDIFINLDNFIHLGKNIEKDFEEINIKNLVLNSVNNKKYIILKIVGGIWIDDGINFLCEDCNQDVINVSIKNYENYFNVSTYDALETEVFTKGKYITIIEPDYGIFKENDDTDEIKVSFPNEIIILKDKDELIYFFDKRKNISPENYKLLGNLMINNNFYEQAIFFYKEAIKINNNDDNMEIVLHSNLAEAFLKYGYFTKCINNSDYCLEKIFKSMKEDKKEKDNFLRQQKIKNLFRKIKCLVSLRKFTKAYEILYDILYNNKSEDNQYKDIKKDFLKLEQVKRLSDIIRDGYQNNLGNFNYKKMLQEEKSKFELHNGDYLNPKIEIKSESGKGIKMVAKEKINIGELLIVEKALTYSRSGDDFDEGEDIIVSKENPKVIVEIELFNKLYLNLNKYPLDNEKFYFLCDGKNTNENFEERKKYLEAQDSGKIKLDYFKINQAICLNKYGCGRKIIGNTEKVVGLWGFASLFNHDCLANTSHFSIGDYYIGYSINEIEKGEEITANYCVAKLPYQERQKRLLENWRFNCVCQLCKYQKNKKDIEFEKYIKLFYEPSKEIPRKEALCFEEYLEKNKKKFNCFDMALAYLKLEFYYFLLKDLEKTKKCSELVTKYAKGKNYLFQLDNLYNLFLCIISCHSMEFFDMFKEIINYLEKYLPLKREEIEYFIKDKLNLK